MANYAGVINAVLKGMSGAKDYKNAMAQQQIENELKQAQADYYKAQVGQKTAPTVDSVLAQILNDSYGGGAQQQPVTNTQAEPAPVNLADMVGKITSGATMGRGDPAPFTPKGSVADMVGGVMSPSVMSNDYGGMAAGVQNKQATGPLGLSKDQIAQAAIYKALGIDPIQEQKFKAEQDEKKRLSDVQSQSVKDAARAALNTINEIEKGIKYFGPMGNIPQGMMPLDTERANWDANVNRLKNKMVVDLMMQMKAASKTGATGFGQLSEKEGQRLENAATALQRGLKEEDAQKYLNEIRASAKKVLGEDQSAQISKEDAVAELKRRGVLK